MANEYCYSAFGLLFRSETEIPEFISMPVQEGDVRIKLGVCPAKLDGVKVRGLRYQVAESRFLLKVDGIANYYVEDGCSITIEPFAGAEMSDVRLFLLGSVLGILFQQRRLIPLHASTLVANNKAVVFSGGSGSGKSTLCAYLIGTGLFRPVSDDITVLSRNNLVMARSGYPSVKLWEDSLGMLSLDFDPGQMVRDGIRKYWHRWPGDLFFHGEVPVSHVFFMDQRTGKEVSCSKMRPSERFVSFRKNTFRERFITGENLLREHLETGTALLNQARIYRLSRPKEVISPAELAEPILKILNHGS
jgi:energy-coupling factor transporter ATP-binding protein EcfA2